MKEISIVGLGYVGLTFAVSAASRGFRVIGVEVDEHKRRSISEGVSPIYEEGLEPMLREAISKGMLRVTESYGEAVEGSGITFICVGTPSREDGSVDLSQVIESSSRIGEALRNKDGYHLVVVRSTIPPGTTIEVVKKILEERSGKRVGEELGLCFNPEFLREGRAMKDTLNPDRLIIGAYDEKSGKTLLEFYRRFYRDRMPKTLLTNPVNAELIKYANNAFLAMKISYANMVSRICEKLPGADVEVVMDGIGMDKRIERTFLGAGLGWGGSCFPKDTIGFLKFAENLGVDLKLVKASIEINEEQLEHAIELADALIGGLRGKIISVLGLAFKPGTDDVRGSRAIKLVKKLLERGASVKVHDPRAMGKARKILGDDVEYAGSVEECIRGSDLCILATEWPEYRKIRARDLSKLMRNPAILDCRRLYDPEEFRDVRFAAIGLGLDLWTSEMKRHRERKSTDLVEM